MQLTPEQMLKYARELTWAELEKEAGLWGAAKGGFKALTTLRPTTAVGDAISKVRQGANAGHAAQELQRNVAGTHVADLAYDIPSMQPHRGTARPVSLPSKVPQPAPTIQRSSATTYAMAPGEQGVKPSMQSVSTAPAPQRGNAHSFPLPPQASGQGQAALHAAAEAKPAGPVAETMKPGPVHAVMPADAYHGAPEAPKTEAPATTTTTTAAAAPTTTSPPATAEKWHNTPVAHTPQISVGQHTIGPKAVTPLHIGGALGAGGVAAAGTGYMLHGNGGQQKSAAEAWYAARLMKHAYNWGQLAKSTGIATAAGGAAGGAAGAVFGDKNKSLGERVMTGAEHGALGTAGAVLGGHAMLHGALNYGHKFGEVGKDLQSMAGTALMHPHLHGIGANVAGGAVKGVATVGLSALAGGEQQQKSAAEQLYEAHLTALDKQAGIGTYVKAFKSQYGVAKSEGRSVMQGLREGHAAGGVASTAENNANNARIATIKGKMPMSNLGKAALGTVALGTAGGLGFGAAKLTEPAKQEGQGY